MQPVDGGMYATGEVARNQNRKGFGHDFLHVLAAMPSKCSLTALRARETGLSRAEGKSRKAPARATYTLR